MSRNTMSVAEEHEYADWLLELTQQARYEKKKHANEQWHQIAERLAHAFGAGDPDAGRVGSRGRVRAGAPAVALSARSRG